jgi:hypothetical protein
LHLARELNEAERFWQQGFGTVHDQDDAPAVRAGGGQGLECLSDMVVCQTIRSPHPGNLCGEFTHSKRLAWRRSHLDDPLRSGRKLGGDDLQYSSLAGAGGSGQQDRDGRPEYARQNTGDGVAMSG